LLDRHARIAFTVESLVRGDVLVKNGSLGPYAKLTVGDWFDPHFLSERRLEPATMERLLF
jgi:hypothetical protein